MLFKKELASSDGDTPMESPDTPTKDADKDALDKWKALTNEQRNAYVERSKTEERAAGTGEHIYVYECSWASCEHQYEDAQDLMIHVMEGSHLVKDGK